ncbi:MAG: NADH dehydrogenase (quinone) subunit G [Zetaproteobacteria bacterium CG12_big_fil_rev_8_21_14_0_65_55_1124]|nr:MAG: NADH dehydrogenase (quinone) subunit G [Zetaproteobacteria bacterium CG1_02_55_237]PIS19282.1 MAG: NADH dehydrogenase (quinone) subunit G [Zetaproteobacteria bacterium CG08_land_8_20_14_0_20_55_17]PIW43541.1 MAG: NADH dehydrogenase (quinone) subunit G [Zetaproteobacteria bacterium CG12_big_fil_rev_8_21_14_0_65_55_1124]PIY54405.1 MAG: NADH dehydrogenase (quinone) subunit G [Zetaproteobacteria bacterium CG_4_10_14_0_8_um_filter_55_43]PIZ39004.1 MAG: NADH dehydrogenase (quinone) subunit G 
MTTLYINDVEVTVSPGTSILEACQAQEVNVPYFCYHPELSVAANCRMCLVEVEGWPKPAASCSTPVSEGMKVRTQSESLEKDHKMTMEYLLINHPLDCPVCDQGGECKLQDYAVEYGTSKGRYTDKKRVVNDYELGPFVTTSMTRCIHCTRCVRFADEIAGTGDIGVLNRGDHMSIAGIVDECLSSELSGNLPDVCPVGALLDGPSHDVSRPWELTRHKSTCTQCPNGCDIEIESRGNEVIRIQPVAGSPEPWLCDRGRYVYDAFRSENRILAPRVRDKDEMRESSWDTAVQRAVEQLKGKRIGMIISPFWSVEGFTAIRLLRDLAFPDAKVAFDLHRRDMRPFAFEEGFVETTQQIEDADEVVILGCDLRQRLPLMMQRLRKRLNKDKPVTRIGSMNYRTNAAISKEALIRPRDWAEVIARAMQQVTDLGKSAAGMKEWMAAVEGRHEAGKLLADALMSESCSLIVGEEIRCHPDAAALIHGLDLLMRGCGHAEAEEDGRNLVPEGMNAQVLSAVFGDVRCSAGDIFEAAEKGELDAILLVGSDPVGDGLFPAQARKALNSVPLVQVGAVSGEVSGGAQVKLPAAAYSEIEGAFLNMEGRVRVASNPISSIGQERPLWKVMMRLVQALGHEVPVVNLDELRQQVVRFLPGLGKAWKANKVDSFLMPTARNAKAVYLPAKVKVAAGELDVVGRYSMYREGVWARASALLSHAGVLHALDDVIVHPDTLRELGLEPGELTVVSDLGEQTFAVATRDDVSPGVLFVAKRGVAGDLSNSVRVSLRGGTA